VIEDAELNDGGGLDGKIGVDADGLEGVKLDGVESGMAKGGSGAGVDGLLELLLERCG
jgi:hypothetical protein